MSELIIINGRVIDPFNDIDSEQTVVVRDGKISSLEKAGKKNLQKFGSAKVIDAKGGVVCPGFVDTHVHLREPGYEYKEDIVSGTKAAVAGGFTTICCMPNTSPVNDTASVTEYILKRAAVDGFARVLPVAAISKGLKGETMADIGDQAKAGVVALTDDGKPVMNALLLRRVAEYALGFDLPIMDHCEDLNLTSSGVMHEGSVSTELGLRGIPAAAEESHIARDIALARQTGAHFHITHVSTAAGLEMIRQAKKKKLPITCDVTPHHLTLTDESVRGYSTNMKVNPPLRPASDVKELIKGLVDGTIDAIVTDHAPHGVIEKELGFDTASFGMIGLETALPVLLQLVHDKKISMKKLVALLTSGLNVLKGKDVSTGFKKGSVADITVFNPDEKVTINADDFYSKSRNTPFDNFKLKGKVLYTILGGEVVFDNEKGVFSPQR